MLKFGGTSVGTPDSILRVKAIVEAAPQPIIVVVSALGGVTDALIALSESARQGGDAYRQGLAELRQRHHRMVESVIAPTACAALTKQIDALVDELASILYGVSLIQDLPAKTADAIVAYGERLSSLICAHLFHGAVHYDSRSFIKTVRKDDKHVVDFDSTTPLVRQTFADCQQTAVLGGFIASDRDSGATTNLGRGGSDYTAAIVAAALDAEALEIWTDVDGFMTADPRVIPSAYTIDELSYNEAMELCNFGAKVVYPPTIYPVCRKDIPILVKNTFNPTAAGSILRPNYFGTEKRYCCPAASILRTPFSAFALGIMISCPQPTQRSLKSIPTRSTKKRFSPQGCFFFMTRVSPTAIFKPAHPFILEAL